MFSLGMRHRNIPSRRALASMLNDDDENRSEISMDSLDLDASTEAQGLGGGGGGGRGSAERGRDQRGRDISQFFVRMELVEGDEIYEKGAMALYLK